MPRSLFMRIRNSLIGRGIFKAPFDGAKRWIYILEWKLLLHYESWRMKCHTTKLTNFAICQKVLFVIYFITFIEGICRIYATKYLRASRVEDLRQILAINDSQGFSGYVGSWDIQQWKWKNFPVEWVEQFKGENVQLLILKQSLMGNCATEVATLFWWRALMILTFLIHQPLLLV